MSVMDLSSVVTALQTGVYSVTRHLPDQTVDGIAVAGQVDHQFTCGASIQPAEPKHMDRMPSGTRIEDARMVFSVAALYPANVHTGTPADTISIDGQDFQVESIWDWSSSGNVKQTLVRKEPR